MNVINDFSQKFKETCLEWSEFTEYSLTIELDSLYAEMKSEIAKEGFNWYFKSTPWAEKVLSIPERNERKFSKIIWRPSEKISRLEQSKQWKQNDRLTTFELKQERETNRLIKKE